MKVKIRALALITILAVAMTITGCATPKIDSTAFLCRDNDILSYEPMDVEKIVITIENSINTNMDPLIAAIKERFPQVEVLLSISNGYGYLEQQAKNNEMSDIVFTSVASDLSDYFYDLSSLSFTNRYNLTSLEALSINNKIYQLPVASSGVGIFYNKTLFDQKGWEIPQTLDEFYSLCDTIQADGIRPFAPCLKYAATVADVGIGFSNRELFGNVYSAERFYEFTEGNVSSSSILEPFLTALRNLYQSGLITDDDFTSSATQNRQAMYAGEIAMVPYSLNLASYYDTEKPACELGFMGFPTNQGERFIALSHDETCMSLSRRSMEDPLKKQILLDIFDFITTNEGQSVLFQSFTGISSVKTYQSNITSRFKEVMDCMDNGRIYFPKAFWGNDDNALIKEWITGDMEIDEMFKALDMVVQEDLNSVEESVPIGIATDTFSVMETSAFMADSFRETTNADIALVLNKTLYKGIIMKLYKGEIYNSSIFYIRGASGANCLTVYEITGKNLKALLEHPFVNGEEVNATYVPSGLKMTYAPWADMNNNVLSLTLANGAPIDDERVYTVAAWDSTIDEMYISRVVKRYEEHSYSVDYMAQIIKAKGVVSPPRDGRITLDWKTR